jgi:hypothetical protein
MKKVLFVTLLVVSASAAFSQINKGQWLAGGNAAFASEKQGDYKMTAFNLSPDAGYFFINNFAGGLRINLESSEVKSVEDSKSTSFSVAPFVRYYFLPASQKVNVFADANYSFGSMKEGSASSVSNSGFGIMAGPAFFLTPNTALEVTVGYNSSKANGATDRTNIIAFGAGFQIHLGGAKK